MTAQSCSTDQASYPAHAVMDKHEEELQQAESLSTALTPELLQLVLVHCGLQYAAVGACSCRALQAAHAALRSSPPLVVLSWKADAPSRSGSAGGGVADTYRHLVLHPGLRLDATSLLPAVLRELRRQQMLPCDAAAASVLLAQAAELGHARVVQAALEEWGADASYQHEEPLRLACVFGHVAVARLLVKAGAKPFSKPHPPVHAAVKAGHADIVALLADSCGYFAVAGSAGPPPQRRQEDQHALNELFEEAALAGHANVCEVLLARGADAQFRGNYALKAACHRGHTQVVRLLLSAGATPCQLALWFAGQNSHTEVVGLLLAAGVQLVES